MNEKRRKFNYFSSEDKQKIYVRIITGITVSFLILAGSPFFDSSKDSANALSNPYAFSPEISNLSNSEPTSSGSYISWNTNVSSNSRVYYGTNQSEVNNLTNGKWSMWANNVMKVNIRISGLSANNTYYYKPESWYLNVANDSIPANVFTTLKSGVWTSSTEYMVSPPGWAGSPVNFRTVNISAAILDNNGHYITNLSSIEAVIYNNTGSEIGRANLYGTGTGPYTGNYILQDYLKDGGYIIKITGYPNISGEFSILRWSCVNCHSAGGANYPSTFDAITVHPKHLDTTQINTVHCGDDLCEYEVTYTSTSECGNCHVLRYPTWVQHPQSYECNNCHRSGGNTCEDCHADYSTRDNFLSPRYGEDVHSNLTCNNCHNSLNSITTKPNCTTCHPRPGSIISNTTIPSSIENGSHNTNQTVACGLCHNREHDIKSLQTLDNTVCRNCHPSILHDNGSQCTQCHRTDPHNVYNPHSSYTTEQECRSCHGNNTANTHHLLVANGEYQCSDCHKMIYDKKTKQYYPELIRNCLVCHRFN